MITTFRCPHCAHVMTLAQAEATDDAKCSACGRAAQVPFLFRGRFSTDNIEDLYHQLPWKLRMNWQLEVALNWLAGFLHPRNLAQWREPFTNLATRMDDMRLAKVADANMGTTFQATVNDGREFVESEQP